MKYEFSTELKEEKNSDSKSSSNNNYINLIIFFIFIIILILFISFNFWRKLKIKNRNLENKVNAIDFSSGINEDLIITKELSENRSDSYENTFI